MRLLLLCNIPLRQQTLATKANPTLDINSLLHPIMVRTSKAPAPHQWQEATESRPLIRRSSWVCCLNVAWAAVPQWMGRRSGYGSDIDLCASWDGLHSIKFTDISNINNWMLLLVAVPLSSRIDLVQKGVLTLRSPDKPKYNDVWAGILVGLVQQ